MGKTPLIQSAERDLEVLGDRFFDSDATALVLSERWPLGTGDAHNLVSVSAS